MHLITLISLAQQHIHRSNPPVISEIQRHDTVSCWCYRLSWWRQQIGKFSACLVLCDWNPPLDSPHKGQWRGAVVFSLICAWTNGWKNSRDNGNLRRHRDHYDVIVMNWFVTVGYFRYRWWRHGWRRSCSWVLSFSGNTCNNCVLYLGRPFDELYFPAHHPFINNLRTTFTFDVVLL